MVIYILICQTILNFLQNKIVNLELEYIFFNKNFVAIEYISIKGLQNTTSN